MNLKKQYEKLAKINRWLGPFAMLLILFLFFDAMIQNDPVKVLFQGLLFFGVSMVQTWAYYMRKEYEERK